MLYHPDPHGLEVKVTDIENYSFLRARSKVVADCMVGRGVGGGGGGVRREGGFLSRQYFVICICHYKKICKQGQHISAYTFTV